MVKAMADIAGKIQKQQRRDEANKYRHIPLRETENLIGDKNITNGSSRKPTEPDTPMFMAPMARMDVFTRGPPRPWRTMCSTI